MTEPNKLVELAARAIGMLAGGRDGLQGSAVGKVAGSGVVSKGLGAAEILAHLGVLAGWVDNKTATSLQMAEATVDYLGGKVDGKTTVGQFASAYTDRLIYGKMTENGVGNFAAKATSYVVSGFIGMIVGRLAGAVEEGVIGKDTTLGKALEALSAQKAERSVAPPAHTASGLPPQSPAGGAGGRAAAQGAH